MNITISSSKDLNKVVEALLDFANEKQKFLLLAEMGSGKTTFVKAFCNAMGVKGETSSPTFSLVNEYQYEKGLIRHLDLYRLKKLDEAIDFGIEDFFYDNHYLFIEWPEILEPILPEGMILIRISVNEKQERIFNFEKI